MATGADNQFATARSFTFPVSIRRRARSSVQYHGIEAPHCRKRAWGFDQTVEGLTIPPPSSRRNACNTRVFRAPGGARSTGDLGAQIGQPREVGVDLGDRIDEPLGGCRVAGGMGDTGGHIPATESAR